MPNLKISELPSGGALQGTDLFVVARAGGNVRILGSSIIPSVAWGGITGTLSNQTDLQNELNDKQDVITSADDIVTNSIQGGNLKLISNTLKGLFTPIDQSFENDTSGLLTADAWQSFTCGISGPLPKVAIKTGTTATGTYNVEIRNGTGAGGSQIAGVSYTFTGAAGWKTIEFPSPATLTASSVYTIRIARTGGSNITWRRNTSGGYSGGTFVISGQDGAFRTYTEQEANVYVDETTGYLGFEVASPSYPFDFDGDLNISSGSLFRIDGIESLEEDVITVKEGSTPTPRSGYGKYYTKSDNKPYFQDGSGSEHDLLAGGGAPFGEKEVTTVNVASYNALSTDDILDVTYTSTGASSVQLMTANTYRDKVYTIVDGGNNAQTNNITITTEGGALIQGAASLVIDTNETSISLYCDGTNWKIY